MLKTQATLLHEIRSILTYHHQMGIELYPLSKGIDTFIETTKNCTGFMEHGVPDKNIAHAQEVQPVEKGQNLKTVEEIADEVQGCTGCSLSAKRIIPVPGGGGRKVVIFIVGSWLTGIEGERLPESTIFGVEEDAMVARMLSAIHIKREEAFVTNLIKCGIPSSVQPVAENIIACSSYLHRQIAAVDPDIICTMGMIASRIFLDIPRSLSQLRGKFYAISTINKKEIPLLPTYHPTFLLQNPEMKKATWVDLQLIEKELKKIGKA